MSVGRYGRSPQLLISGPVAAFSALSYIGQAAVSSQAVGQVKLLIFLLFGSAFKVRVGAVNLHGRLGQRLAVSFLAAIRFSTHYLAFLYTNTDPHFFSDTNGRRYAIFR